MKYNMSVVGQIFRSVAILLNSLIKLLHFAISSHQQLVICVQYNSICPHTISKSAYYQPCLLYKFYVPSLKKLLSPFTNIAILSQKGDHPLFVGFFNCLWCLICWQLDSIFVHFLTELLLCDKKIIKTASCIIFSGLYI
jgi:hypothetical protein